MSISMFFENRHKKHLQNKIRRLKKISSFVLKRSEKAKEHASRAQFLMDSNACLFMESKPECSAAYLEHISYYSDELSMYEALVHHYYKRHTSIENKIASLENELKNL